jgi:hypothetical protein
LFYSGAAFAACCVAELLRARFRPPSTSSDSNVLLRARPNKQWTRMF